MRVLTEYEGGAGPKQDILEEEHDEMEVDATGGGASDAEGNASDSDSERVETLFSKPTCYLPPACACAWRECIHVSHKQAAQSAVWL